MSKFFVFSGRGFFERDFQVVTQIRAAMRRSPPRTAAAAAAEHIAETEHVENVFDIGKSRIKARAARSRADALMTETVISRALLRIGQEPNKPQPLP